MKLGIKKKLLFIQSFFNFLKSFRCNSNNLSPLDSLTLNKNKKLTSKSEKETVEDKEILWEEGEEVTKEAAKTKEDHRVGQLLQQTPSGPQLWQGIRGPGDTQLEGMVCWALGLVQTQLRASPGQGPLSDTSTLQTDNEPSERNFLKTYLHAYTIKHNYKL